MGLLARVRDQLKEEMSVSNLTTLVEGHLEDVRKSKEYRVIGTMWTPGQIRDIVLVPALNSAMTVLVREVVERLSPVLSGGSHQSTVGVFFE